MAKIDREKFISAPGVFFLYIFLSSLAIFIFRFFYPGEEAPLEYFSSIWRFVRGGLDIIHYFPALALSALVIPFGLRSHSNENNSSFSPKFLKNISPSIFCAIIAAGIYACLFLLVQPLVLNYEANLRSQGRLWRLSADQAKIYAAQGNWSEVDRLVDITESIWPYSVEMEEIRVEAYIQSQERMLSAEPIPYRARPVTLQDLMGASPLTVIEALVLAEQALREERYYDAHWLASLASELAGPGSAETARIAQISNQAWNAANSLEPNAQQTEAYAIFMLKRDAYRALHSHDYLRSYYLFLDLINLDPRDREAPHFLRLSEEGLSRIAFFIDEMDIRQNPQGAIFSLPQPNAYPEPGRLVMSFSSLSVFPDAAYGFELEILSYNQAGGLLWSIQAPYAKILPFSQGGRVSVIMRAFDRVDNTRYWEPVAQNFSEVAPIEAQFTLDLSWSDFLLLSGLRRGKENLNIGELISATQVAANYGYLSQVFEAELLSRFAEPVLFLPFLIIVLIFGWRFRSSVKPRFIWIPMLGILPLVLSGVLDFFRSSLANFSIWAVIYTGFPLTIIVISVGTLIVFFISLVVLAFQRS